MIVYFSWKKHTQVYAEELASLLQEKAFALEETEHRDGMLGFVKGGYQSVTRKETVVKEMPDISRENVLYLCTPVWAGGIPPAIRYFINHAPLQGKKVHFLMTCANITGNESYRENALRALEGKGCEPGQVYVFASEADPDRGIIKEHLQKMVLEEA